MRILFGNVDSQFDTKEPSGISFCQKLLGTIQVGDDITLHTHCLQIRTDIKSVCICSFSDMFCLWYESVKCFLNL